MRYLIPTLLLCVVCGCSKKETPAPAAAAAQAPKTSDISSQEANSYKATMHQMHPDDPKYK